LDQPLIVHPHLLNGGQRHICARVTRSPLRRVGTMLSPMTMMDIYSLVINGNHKIRLVINRSSA
jgi:hypothetical protein